METLSKPVGIKQDCKGKHYFVDAEGNSIYLDGWMLPLKIVGEEFDSPCSHKKVFIQKEVIVL